MARLIYQLTSSDVMFFGKVRDGQAELSTDLLIYLLTYLLT